MVKRDQKRAFTCSQKFVEQVDLESKTLPIKLVTTEPYAAKLFSHLSDPKGTPATTAYLNHFVEENPEACSQDVYENMTMYLSTIDGKPIKKRSKKKNN